MKILSGKLTGRPIAFRPQAGVRPTADRARKAVFDILRSAVEGQSVLDLFSGSGAMGMEALSNGACRAVFVEKDRALCRVIEKNLGTLGLTSGSVICREVIAAVEALSARGERFGIVIMDPPYQTGLGLETLAAVERSNLIDRDSLIVLECSQRETLPEKMGSLRAIKVKKYGDTKIAIYAKAREQK